MTNMQARHFVLLLLCIYQFRVDYITQIQGLLHYYWSGESSQAIPHSPSNISLSQCRARHTVAPGPLYSSVALGTLQSSVAPGTPFFCGVLLLWSLHDPSPLPSSSPQGYSYIAIGAIQPCRASQDTSELTFQLSLLVSCVFVYVDISEKLCFSRDQKVCPARWANFQLLRRASALGQCFFSPLGKIKGLLCCLGQFQVIFGVQQ